MDRGRRPGGGVASRAPDSRAAPERIPSPIPAPYIGRASGRIGPGGSPDFRSPPCIQSAIDRSSAGRRGGQPRLRKPTSREAGEAPGSRGTGPADTAGPRPDCPDAADGVHAIVPRAATQSSSNHAPAPWAERGDRNPGRRTGFAPALAVESPASPRPWDCLPARPRRERSLRRGPHSRRGTRKSPAKLENASVCRTDARKT
jgi:hypothetical protein